MAIIKRLNQTVMLGFASLGKSREWINSVEGLHIACLLPGSLQGVLKLGCPLHHKTGCARREATAHHSERIYVNDHLNEPYSA